MVVVVMMMITESVSQMHLTKLYEEMEKVCQSCLEKIENIKVSKAKTVLLTWTYLDYTISEVFLMDDAEQVSDTLN